jgi:hypothetical protein
MEARDLARVIAAAAALAGSAATLAADGLVTLGIGAEYSSGKYGSTEDTDILYVPVTAKYETGPWALKLVVPYVRVTGPDNVIGAGPDRVTLSRDAAARRTDSGLGDITASAFYNLLNERRAPLGLDLGAKVKFATADEAAGLGTGEHDYSVQADVFKPIGDTTLFGSLGHRWYGDPPAAELRDVTYWSVGFSHRVSAAATAGVAYDYRPRISASGSAISEATAFVSFRLSPQVRLQLYGIVGFSDGSPDYGAGTALNFSF